jgi:hypothetical protein
MPCLMAMDCSGAELCAQLSGGNTLCTAPCTKSSDCSISELCYAGTSYSGAPINVCVNETGACSPSGTDGGPGSDAGPGSTCAGYAAPDTPAGCSCASGHTCGANNCYGGYFCNLTTNKCAAPPTGCTATTSDGGTITPSPDAGPGGCTSGPVPTCTVTSNVSATSGGTASTLYFAVIGDTRPADDNDTTAYPTSIITKIYSDIQNISPSSPPFVIGTGDYQFDDPGSGNQATQLGYYNTARGGYSGVFWPVMGNHECDGYTASNCASGCPSGDTCGGGSNTENFLVWQSLFLTPIGVTDPWYSRTITATDGSWTAHFIFVALNYWNTTQQSWLQTQLATSATYTFVIHHEGSTAGSPTALATVESMEKGHETLSIVGHSHEWQYNSSVPEVIIGNGGAPLATSNQTYGYTIFNRQPNGNIMVTAYDYSTNTAVSGEQFTVQ